MTKITLSELLSTYSPICPFGERSWETTLENMLHNIGDMCVIEKLCEQYMVESRWREPIVVESNTQDGFSYVIDGTHRVVAAILMNLDTLEIKVDFTEDSLNEFTDVEMFTDVSIYRANMGYDLFNLLRSFPLSTNEWINSDFAVEGSDDEQEIRLFWNANTFNEDTCSLVSQAITQRLITAGFNAEEFSVETLIQEMT